MIRDDGVGYHIDVLLYGHFCWVIFVLLKQLSPEYGIFTAAGMKSALDELSLVSMFKDYIPSMRDAYNCVHTPQRARQEFIRQNARSILKSE